MNSMLPARKSNATDQKTAAAKQTKPIDTRVSYSLRLERGLNERLSLLAVMQGRSKLEILYELIENYVDEHQQFLAAGSAPTSNNTL